MSLGSLWISFVFVVLPPLLFIVLLTWIFSVHISVNLDIWSYLYWVGVQSLGFCYPLYFLGECMLPNRKFFLNPDKCSHRELWINMFLGIDS